ncbi:hypothetical protein MXB_760 [Myxobolus squamalis]|nr:hypothetical protein MXB_760 [Myxobolus squamalis]
MIPGEVQAVKSKGLLRRTIRRSLQLNKKCIRFERYRWFISSENYLVIAGRDAQDNEFLVKRHTNKNDIFVHADLHGAAVVVVKVQKDQIQDAYNLPVPIKTLHEAASFAICFSSVWDSHLTIPAYWVKMDQVLKTAPTGEYLSVGGFSIRGKKNFIQHPVLLLGISVLFKIDQDSIKNHLNDRLPKWHILMKKTKHIYNQRTNNCDEKDIETSSSIAVLSDHKIDISPAQLKRGQKPKTSKKQQKLLKIKEKLQKPIQPQPPFKKLITIQEPKELDIHSDDDDNEPREEEVTI